MKKIVVFNISWMKDYSGNKKDTQYAGGSYNGLKHEVLNFEKDEDGFYYGYVQPPNNGAHLNIIDNLNASGDSLSGVLVIWTALSPKSGRKKIVGWYNDATIFSQMQNRKVNHYEFKKLGYFVKSKDIHLLPFDERNFSVSDIVKGRNINYLIGTRYNEIKKAILAYIEKRTIDKKFFLEEDEDGEENLTDEEYKEASKELGIPRTIEEAERRINNLIKNKENKEIISKVSRYVRSPLLAKLIKERADYNCEICGAKPFIKINGERYAETHHKLELANGGKDLSKNMVCLCPTCHRVIHFGNEKSLEDRQKLKTIK